MMNLNNLPLTKEKKSLYFLMEFILKVSLFLFLLLFFGLCDLFAFARLCINSNEIKIGCKMQKLILKLTTILDGPEKRSTI